jgi:hypothetical protein
MNSFFEEKIIIHFANVETDPRLCGTPKGTDVCAYIVLPFECSQIVGQSSLCI